MNPASAGRIATSARGPAFRPARFVDSAGVARHPGVIPLHLDVGDIRAAVNDGDLRMTLEEHARQYAQQFRATPNAFGLVDDIASHIRSLRIGGRALTTGELETLLGHLRDELNRTGGMPVRRLDSSNAGSVSLVGMLSGKLGLKGK